MGTLDMIILPLFIDFGNMNISQKPLCLCLYPPTSIEFMCDPLGPYIFLVNDFIDPIILIGLPYQFTISTYTLIKDRFNTINKLS